MNIQEMEKQIAAKMDKLMSYLSLGAAINHMGNHKNLVDTAKNLRKACKKPQFQQLINEIEFLGWKIECLKVDLFIEEQITSAMKKNGYKQPSFH